MSTRRRPTSVGATSGSNARNAHHPKRFRSLRYRFDNAFSAGTGRIIAWLAILAVLIALLGATLLFLTRVRVNGHQDAAEEFWASLLRTLDPGTMASDAGWKLRFVALAVTIAGIIVLSVLIGLVANAIDRKLDHLRKGRTAVVEQDHTLILGWSPKILAIVSELCVANQNRRRAVIVILAPRDRISMEEELRSRRDRVTRIVCRTGSSSDIDDLNMVAAAEARSVVVLRPDDSDGDAHVVRSSLALLGGPLADRATPIIAEIGDVRTAQMLSRATEDRVTTVVSNDVIARITARVCHQQGLSAAYQELLDFEGDEIYFATVPEVWGHTYAEALGAFEHAALLGIRRGDGGIELAPAPATPLQPGDDVIAIAEDDDCVVFTGFRVDLSDLTEPPPATRSNPVEHTLILGWNEFGPILLSELDRSLGSGSSIVVAVHDDHDEHRHLKRIPACANLDIQLEELDLSEPDAMARLLRARSLDHVVVLSYRNGLSPTAADARTLMTLLCVRHELDRLSGQTPGVVAELRDVSDVALVTGQHADDFLVSDRLTALMIAQLSETADLRDVLGPLIDDAQTQLTLIPACELAPLGQAVRFGEVVASGIRRGDSVVGCRWRNDKPASVRLNVAKSEFVQFEDGDQVIVVRPDPSLVAVPAVTSPPVAPIE